GGKFAVEEVDEDAAGGSGFAIVGADGGGGVKNDDLLTGLRSFDRFLFRQKFGALVVADHIAEGHWRVFVGDDAVGIEVHGGDARSVDEALDAGFACQTQQFAGAVDVGLIHG